MTFAAFPAVAVLLGAGVTFIRTPSSAVRSAVQHFAAGVIFCVLATELLPDLVHRKMPLVTVIGFSAGVALMLAVKWMGDQKALTESGRSTSSLMAAMGVDIVLDGVLIGLSFSAGEKQGLLLTIALVLEVFFLGVSCATSLGALGRSKRSIGLACASLAAGLCLGAASGAMVLSHVKPAYVDGMLAFGVAALLYLVTEELLVEAHEEPETPIQTAMFFVGFIVLFTIDMMI
ncbi:transporter [Undibacterium sp. Jales W-56]|uniref:ZIP family metal transporter n=1 Tax=Undibacterium sp. Jales W-56 TaxID=2897325 RepID=UPI0021D1F278|nr:ZIP family metal transporter [Undibacterium sp. Jales W-56]MCU6435284.1 transporter [Undibacterium sp. Jales W-56]